MKQQSLLRRAYHAVIPLSGRQYIGQVRMDIQSICATGKALLRPKNKKQSFRCPCCGTIAPFKSGNYSEYPHYFNPERYLKAPQEVLCPVCGSLPRHRILALWCREHKQILRKARILYFALEDSMRHWFWRNRISCVTADLFRSADLKLDIQQTGLPDASFDLVFCNHVLEHVEDFRAAIRELYRILRPGGYLICSFPIDTGIDLVDEGSPSLPPEEHIRLYGQADHNRVFGINADEFLTSVGFSVQTIHGEDCPDIILPVVGPADYDINLLFCCQKPKETE